MPLRLLSISVTDGGVLLKLDLRPDSPAPKVVWVVRVSCYRCFATPTDIFNFTLKKSAIVLVKEEKENDLTTGKLVEHGTACEGSKPKDVVETAMESILFSCFKH